MTKKKDKKRRENDFVEKSEYGIKILAFTQNA